MGILGEVEEGGSLLLLGVGGLIAYNLYNTNSVVKNIVNGAFRVLGGLLPATGPTGPGLTGPGQVTYPDGNSNYSSGAVGTPGSYNGPTTLDPSTGQSISYNDAGNVNPPMGNSAAATTGGYSPAYSSSGGFNGIPGLQSAANITPLVLAPLPANATDANGGILYNSPHPAYSGTNNSGVRGTGAGYNSY